MITASTNYDEVPDVPCTLCGGYYKADEPESHDCQEKKTMRDEDLDRCPRCKEDMLRGQKICSSCQREKDLEDWPGGDGFPFHDEVECDICGFKSTDPDGAHYCCEDNSDE